MTVPPRRRHLLRPTARPALASRLLPNEPERALARPQYLPREPPTPGALHEPAVPWLPNEPERAAHARLEAASAGSPVTPAAAVRSGNALAAGRR